MTSTPTAPNRRGARPAWVPRQHGGWAMLLVPLLVGAAASRPDPWQIVLGGAALSAWLCSAALQAWLRSRRRPEHRTPVLVFGAVFAASSAVLVARFPALLATVLVVGPATLVVIGGAKPGTPRDLANSLAQVAQAIVLVPAAALVSGAFELDRVVAGTAVAAAYLVGTVLVVRSVLRERGNAAFALLSIGFHGLATVAAFMALPPAIFWLGAGLTVRAALLPVAERRLAGSQRPLRPIHVGLVEIGAAMAVVVAAAVAPL